MRKRKVYTKKCFVCGTEFTTVSNNQKYCDEQCNRIAQTMKQQKETDYPWYLSMVDWKWHIKKKENKNE